jgi:hypothetical protein
MYLKYISAIYFEHCDMMSNYVIVVYVSSDPGTYMVRIRFAFQNRVSHQQGSNNSLTVS